MNGVYTHNQTTETMAGMYSYTAYGLHINSEVMLPELVPGATRLPVDVDIQMGLVGMRPPKADHSEGYVCGTVDEAYIFVEDVAAYRVTGGNRIIIEAATHVDERVVRLFLLGGALGLLLHQRGLLTLHASALAVAGGAVVFLGDSGEGKSTMAATLHAHGHPLIADDMVALDLSQPGGPRVLPGFPQMKLWPEVAAHLGDAPDNLPLLHPDLEKRARRATGSAPIHALPLRRVYVLSRGRKRTIEPVPIQVAFGEIKHFSYATAILGTPGATAMHLQQCAQLASYGLLRRLRRRRILAHLPAITRLIEADLATA